MGSSRKLSQEEVQGDLFGDGQTDEESVDMLRKRVEEASARPHNTDEDFTMGLGTMQHVIRYIDALEGVDPE